MAYAKTIVPFGKMPAFTLAETLIVLVVLGVIASLTVPALIQRQIESSKRTKIKKAVSVYDYAINKMVVENNLKSDDALLAWADDAENNDCTNTSAYFKIVEKVNGSNCTFKAPDGLYWDISDIENPIVAQTKDDLMNHKADPTSAGTNAFTLSAWFDDNGSLRVDDLAAAAEPTKTELARLYDYLNGKKSTTEDDTPTGKKTLSQICAEKGATDVCEIETDDGITITYRKQSTPLTGGDYTLPRKCTIEGVEYPKGSEECKSKVGENINWVADPIFLDGMEEAKDLEGSTCVGEGDTYGYCADYGDYYNLSKRECEKSGGRLATMAELQASNCGGKGCSRGNGWFWASEEYDSNGAYSIDDGYVDYSSKNNDANQAVCVGN